MFHNVGKIDRIVRVVISLILAVLYFMHVFEGKTEKYILAGAFILFITAMRSCCPLYAILGLGTCGIKSEESENKIDIKKMKL